MPFFHHRQDHWAHAINYMHWGAPKTWYGVPGDEADAFEEVMREAVPDLVESEAGLLYTMVTMVPPGEAVKVRTSIVLSHSRPLTSLVLSHSRPLIAPSLLLNLWLTRCCCCCCCRCSC